MRKSYLLTFVALLGLISWLLFRGSEASPQQASAAIARKLEYKLREQAGVVSRVRNQSSIWSATDDHLFSFDGNQLVAWSTNSFAPDVSWLSDPGQPKFIKTLRGDFLATTSVSADGEVLLSVIPLIERYRITNKYLGPSWNRDIFGDRQPNLSAGPSGGSSPVEIDGIVLFYAGVSIGQVAHGSLSLVTISAGIAALIFLVFIQTLALHRTRRYGLALATLVVGAGTLRGVMVVFNFPGDWVSSPVFDSATFASSSFNTSIGDLFFNSLYVLAFAFYLFYVFPRSQMLRAILRSGNGKKQSIAVLSTLIALFGFLFPFLFYETIFHNSTITLDWTQSLDFDPVRTVAFVSVIAGSASSFLFCHVWFSLAMHLSRSPVRFFAATLLPAALLFLLYYLSQEHNYIITLTTGCVYATALFLTGLYRGLSRIASPTYLYLVLAIAFLSLQASFSIRRFTEERTADLQFRFGQNFLVERDELGEYLLQQASAAIASDPFIQASISSPFQSKNSIRLKVKQVHLSTYFDRYDIQVHLFSSSGEPLDNQSREDFRSFIQEYEGQAGSTGYKGIYFVHRSDDMYAKQYVAVVPVTRQGRALGYITLVLSLKKIVPQSVFPELLVDNRFAEVFKTDQYSYAIFQGSDVVSSFGPFNYESDFNRGWLTQEEGLAGQIAAGQRHIIIEGEGGRKAVVSTNLYPSFFLASNFCFWIMVGTSVITLGFLVHALIRIRSFRLNYATRIQIMVFLALVIPLFVISATTLTWASATAEERLRQDFSDRARMLAERVSPEMEAFSSAGRDQRRLEDFLIEGARLSGIDATVYSRTGKLVATNQLQIFDNLIVSNLINPAAFSKMVANKTSFIEEEHIGRLSYNNAYHLLRSPGSGETLGILSVPFFDSGYSLERSRVVILSNVMIAFTIILVSFTILSLAATRWLTFPLRMITRSLSRTTLKEENKLLDWRSGDEIGLMVGEYNKMVMNLESSKLELARRQKESAWREMAQQVAHEIKNPLTPIKLTLQQMEALVRTNDLSKERAEQSIKNVLAQLEILNDIATSFSSFARMPAPLLERIELLGVVDKAVALYAGHPAGAVTFARPAGEIWIMGDQQLLSRIFSNLILNGLQSGPGRVAVTVSVVTRGGQVIVGFRDNGAGIPAELGDKIFLPHFTTKKSGSGLGLAISRQGIEQSGGRIWFESGPSGTTFFISLPVKDQS